MERVWRREGESAENYERRLEEAYNKFSQTEEGQEELKKFEERIHKVYNEIKKKNITRGRKAMEKKIIELKNIEGQGWDCLICCKNDATTEFTINRPKHGDNVITFRVCNECLSKMQQDIKAHQ